MGTSSSRVPNSISININILELNYDIYLMIYDRLPNLCDRACFASIGYPLYYAFTLWAAKHRNVFDADDAYGMLPAQIELIFSVAGSYMSAVRMHCFLAEQQGIPRCIHTYCPELSELILLVDHDGFCCQNMLQNMKSLKKIVICCQSAREELEYNLKSNICLETVEFKCGYYSGKYLINQPNLKNLILRDCNLWCDRKFGRSIKNLKSLVLIDCVVRDSDVFSIIARNCAELEDLTFSVENSNYSVIAQLPKLKSLTILPEYFERDLKINFLQALVDQKSSQLLFLKLDGDFQITKAHCEYIGQLTALKELLWLKNDSLCKEQLEYFCKLINLELLSIELCSNVIITDEEIIQLRAKFPKSMKLLVKNCGFKLAVEDRWQVSSSTPTDDSVETTSSHISELISEASRTESTLTRTAAEIT